jgi:phospholipase C
VRSAAVVKIEVVCILPNWEEFMRRFVLIGLGLLCFACGRALAGREGDGATATPIKHLVVIFQENISFDHYFGTYPKTVTDSKGHVVFRPKEGSPAVNGLSEKLLTHNPNSAQPFLLSDQVTCDQDHNYTAEQKAYDGGKADEFVEYTEGKGCTVPYEVMGYYDGGVVTAMWNYAQNFAMSDNSYNTVYGPSTPGCLNLISGQTGGAKGSAPSPKVVEGTIIGDLDPYFDDASKKGDPLLTMSGRNVGDLLNGKKISWGWFQGGFRDPSQAHTCDSADPKKDYTPHHEPFQYYASTSNPKHLPPTGAAMIGKDDQANHQYDLADFWSALDSGNLPAVCFLKAPAYQDGHAGHSGPVCEQEFLVETINRLVKSPDWKDMAILISYDDSDGWYDHQAPPVVNVSHIPSVDPFPPDAKTPPAPALGGIQGRMGYGPRLPLMVISSFAKVNYVDHTLTDQTSILRFIEDNWGLGRIGGGSFDAMAGSLEGMFNFNAGPGAQPLFLDAQTGQPTGGGQVN